jgi:hypothetical protein
MKRGGRLYEPSMSGYVRNSEDPITFD